MARKRKSNGPRGHNLPDRSAPDRPKEPLTAATVKIRQTDKEWLEGLSESKSYHVRQALVWYRSEHELVQAIAAKLGVLPGEAIAIAIREYGKGI